MLYIKKLQPSQEILDELNEAKRNFKIQSSDEAATAFDSLTKQTKGLIRDSLIKEQHGLCAYCMKRIKNNDDNAIPTTIIEHYKPKSKYFDLTLDYKNMLAVCLGGKDKNAGKKFLCCDASKGDQEITINPFNHEDMDKIRYRTDGTIYTYPQNDKFEEEINDILRLNGERDKKGNLVNDTSTELVKCRKEAYENLFLKFIKGLKSRNKFNRKNIEKRIRELEQEEPRREFLGVLLYFLKRELKKYQ